MITKEFLYPTHSVRCSITGPSEGKRSVFLAKLNLKNFNESQRRSYRYSK